GGVWLGGSGVGEPRMPWAKAVVVTVVVFLVAGVVAGWAWQQFSPLAEYTVDDRGGSLGEEQMTRIFGPDGTFTAIGFVAAVVLGAALFWWLRNYGPWSVAIVVLGACLGSGVSWGVGMLLGPDPLDARLRAAHPGDLVAAPLELHTWTPAASWLVGAALACAIIAAASWRADPVATTPAPAASEPGPPVH
ncbi:MAG: hypothetical protein HOV67_01095, partial [Kribbellaceae bacterium]|nr:hypothetical protein [Kribbellaceae bacterium]